MSTTVGYAPKLSSGIDLIDETWEGLYQGGSYLVYGRSANNRDLVPLLFAARGGSDKPCLYLSSGPADDVGRRAQSMGVDLYAQGPVDVRRLPHLADPLEMSDGRLASVLSDVVEQVENAHSQRVVFDDFMPFVAFHSFDRFRGGLIDMLERIDAVDATLMLIMPEPANEESEAVIDFMRRQMTGALHITQTDDERVATVRRIAFLPNIGHVGHEAERDWDVGRWIRPSAEPSGRRFRFSSESGPSPRRAQWDEGSQAGHRAGPAVPSFRLGGDGPPSTTSSQSRVSAHRDGSAERRIPRIPLGKSEEGPGRSGDAERTSARKQTQLGAPAPERPAFKPAVLAEAPHYRTSHTDRDAFRARLQQQFLRHDVDQTPFVLIAMRMDRPDEGARPFDFDFILDLVSESLRDQDDMLVDLDRERLIVMLAESRPNASQPFFGRLKQRLRDEAPQQADYLMRSVSAIVVPNGRPFRTAEEFLTYALDEDEGIAR